MLLPPLPGVDHTILETTGLRHTQKSIHSKERKVGTVLTTMLGLLWEHREATLAMCWREAG